MAARRRRSFPILSILFLLLLFLLGAIHVFLNTSTPSDTPAAADVLTIVTWNVRGYPEKDPRTAQWFHNALAALNPDIVCVQEIANFEKVRSFLSTEAFASAAFLDSSDGQDNAIFAKSRITMIDVPDPRGFQHPAQQAYVQYAGFDAVVITVHLSWSDVGMREHEKTLLAAAVEQALTQDPDVIVVGDFNTKEDGIQELAAAAGLRVMVPGGQDGVGTTHAGNRYDHFLVSPDLAAEEAIDCAIRTFAGTDLELAAAASDHLPVVARFRTDAHFRDSR
jgi:endonuclease/exonuclease/phosphatase family metal-dependent hydrolase